MIEIDLNARVLTEAHNVFVVRPGSDFRLFNEIRENDLIVLELPGLDWPVGEALSDTDLRRRVNRSRALRGWHRVSADDPKPSLEGGGQSTSQFAGYRLAKDGDLVGAVTREGEEKYLRQRDEGLTLDRLAHAAPAIR